MVALAAADVTVTVTTRKRGGSGLKIHFGTLAFGDGALTYPTAGVPLPAFGNFGFVRNIEDIQVTGVNGLTTDYHTQYDKTNNTLLLYEEEAVAAGGPLLEADTAEAPAARTYSFVAWGW